MRGFIIFFLELKTEHVSSEQPPSFVKNAPAATTAAEDWAEPFWYSRAVHKGLCAAGPTREVPNALTLGKP